jgi:hypothetical protein
MNIFQNLINFSAITICFCLMACGVAFGSDGVNVQEPGYTGVISLLDSDTGNLTPLERKSVETKTNTSFGGFGGASTILIIKGEKSPIRFKEGQKIEFVVRVASQESDPQSIIQFFTLKSIDNERQMVLATAGSMGMNGRSVMNESKVSFNADKYGKSSFRFAPAQNLAPGEYTLSAPGNHDGFCFGIDPSGK